MSVGDANVQIEEVPSSSVVVHKPADTLTAEEKQSTATERLQLHNVEHESLVMSLNLGVKSTRSARRRRRDREEGGVSSRRGSVNLDIFPSQKQTSDDETDAAKQQTETDTCCCSSSSLKNVDKAQLERWFLHPYARIFFAYGIIGGNFLIFAEDPVAHSVVAADIPILGSAYSMVILNYGENSFQSFIKVLFWLVFGIISCVFARQIVHHRWLRDWRKISMFSQNKGTWFIMFLFSFPSLWITSYIYNGFVNLAGWSEDLIIDSTLGMSWTTFAKAAATGTWLGDFVTAAMVTDMMLQSPGVYVRWAPKLRLWWRTSYGGYGRIIAFWCVFCTTTLTFFGIILNPDTFNWDRINQTGLTTSEFSRAWLASVITFFDLAIVIADWEFPWFENEMAIKLPGMNITDIHWQCLDRLPEWFSVFVSGKWFNYGIICIVMMLDFNMYKNQVLYIPSDYMQYVDPDGFVWTVEDTLEIDLIREDPSLLSWEARNGRVFDGLQDVVSNSQYLEYGFIAMLSSFIPIVFGLGLFVYLIHKDAALDREGETPMKHRLVVDEEEEAAKQASRAAVAEAKQKRDLEEAQEVEAAVAQKQRLREQQKLSSVKVTPL